MNSISLHGERRVLRGIKSLLLCSPVFDGSGLLILWRWAAATACSIVSPGLNQAPFIFTAAFVSGGPHVVLAS